MSVEKLMTRKLLKLMEYRVIFRNFEAIYILYRPHSPGGNRSFFNQGESK